MKYRPLSATGDFTIGRPFYTNTPQAVAQAVLTRLKLWLGEWFIDTTDGTPYLTQVLGTRLGKAPDAAIKSRILGTPGVTQLISYNSSFTGSTRVLTVTALVQTQFSTTPIQVSANVTVGA